MDRRFDGKATGRVGVLPSRGSACKKDWEDDPLGSGHLHRSRSRARLLCSDCSISFKNEHEAIGTVHTVAANCGIVAD